MKKILTSPKGNRGKGNVPPFKTFGVHLDYLYQRDDCDVPRIVRRLCEYLKKHGMHQEGLFRVNGNIKVVDKMKSLFDKNGDANLEQIGDVAACASLLKMFLRELEDPVIPDHLQPMFVDLQHEYCHDKVTLVSRVKELVQRMPTLNRALLKYLCEFILYISASSEGNRMTPLALAIVFGPNIFRCGDGLEGLRDQAYVNAVFLLLLQEFDQIFDTDHLEEGTSSETSTLQRNQVTCQAINYRSPNISRSPTHSASKQLVENTINVAVKEILFGPGLITSSCESDRTDDDGASRRKTCPFEMTAETLNEGLVCQTRRTKCCHRSERKNVYDRCMSSPHDKVKNGITDEDLEFVRSTSAGPLKQLTPSRVKPPSNRRKPTSRRSRCTPKEYDNEPTGSAKDLPMSNVATKGFVYHQHTANMKNDNAIDTNRVRGNVADSDGDAPKQILEDRGCDQSAVHHHHNEIFPTHQRSPPDAPKRKLSSNTHHKPLGIESSPGKCEPLDRYEIDSGSRKHAQENDKLSPTSLKRKIASFKNIISNLEANFEEANGRKPKAYEQREAAGYLEELSRAKRLLKEISLESCHRDESPPEFPPRVHGCSNSSEGPNEAEEGDLRRKKETLYLVMKKLYDKRVESRRPEEILKMNSSQLKDEKLAVQKGLLMYESQHGRPVSEEDKALMRPLYNHYRKIKRRIAAGLPEPFSKECASEIESNYDSSNSNLQMYREGSTGKAGHSEINVRVSVNYPVNFSQSTPPTLDHRQNANKDDDDDDDDGGTDVENKEENNVKKLVAVTDNLHDAFQRPHSPSYGGSRGSEDAILHEATVEELMEQWRLVKHTKKRLGRLLKNFEEDFFRQYGRKIQRNDRLPKQDEYREYKLTKAKLRLIEALVQKKTDSFDG